MDGLQWRAVFAGVFFGVWPVLMSKSGLNGYVSSAAFELAAFLVIAPFALSGIKDIPPDVQWWFVLGAGLCGGMGLLPFNEMLAKATPRQVGKLFALMTAVQIIIAAAYHVYKNGGLSVSKAIGFALVAVGGFLLL